MNLWHKAVFGIAIMVCALAAPGGKASEAANLQAMVEADWSAQEVRLGRTAGSPQSIQEALKRGHLLLNDLRSNAKEPKLASPMASLGRLEEEARRLGQLDAPARLRLYRQIRTLVRETALQNPLLTSRPLVFLKRTRFPCQMLHEHVAYFNQYGNAYGGGVFVLEEPGRSLKVARPPWRTPPRGMLHLPGPVLRRPDGLLCLRRTHGPQARVRLLRPALLPSVCPGPGRRKTAAAHPGPFRRH